MLRVPVTRVWHAGDVALGLVAMRKPTPFNIARLIFALVGLIGNIAIERSQLGQDIIEVGGVKWRRLDH